MTIRFSLLSLSLLFVMLACNDQTTVQETSGTDSAATAQVDSLSVNQPSLVLPDSEGHLLLTATNGTGIGPNIKYMPEWKAFGWFETNNKVQWDVEVSQAGKYEVELEWSVDDKEAGKEYILQAQSDSITGTINRSGSWYTFVTEKIGIIRLEKGRQQITFRPRTEIEGALMDLRQLSFSPVN